MSRQDSADIIEFKSKLLPLDFFHDIADDTGVEKELTRVPLHFDDEQQYINILMPLFWEEARAQIHRCKSIDMSDSSERVHQVSFKEENGWLRLELRREKEESNQQFYGFGDLCVLTQSANPTKEHPVHFLAMVDMSTGTALSITTKFGADVGTGSRVHQVALIVAQAGSWHLAKVTNLSTMIREYESLRMLPKIHLKPFILNRDDSGLARDASTEMQAAPPPGGGGGSLSAEKSAASTDEVLSIPDKLEEWLRANHNEPQQQAIHECRKVSGITLVQGPPGTGKTKTALGILAVLLNSKAREAKAVSYTRTAKRKAPGTVGADGESSEEEEGASDEAIAQREQERVLLLRSRAPWLRGGFTPWTEALEQEVPVAGSASWRKPFPKLAPEEVVSLSEVSENAAPQKVLVCAPSNAAVDEVLRRVVQNGIAGPDGEPKKPAIVRIGPNLHPDLEEYSLEKIVSSRVAAQSDTRGYNRRDIEKQRLIRDARIVCSTLSVSGSRDITGFEGGFDTVLVDEASQGVELSTLVPLKLGCRRLILIGDPQQLPATVFSHVASAHQYDRSLFERLQQSQHKVCLLHVQYRMHEQISAFPSEHFYSGTLRNGHEPAAFDAQCPAPWSHIPCFGHVAFFSVKGSMDRVNGSYVNDAEADFVIQFFVTLRTLYPQENWLRKLCVISPYAQQVHLLRVKFRALYKLSNKQPCPLDVNTVDGFQGREKDCVLVSMVRANPKGTVGFLSDRRRMNVAFTRARTNLWVVGRAEVLRRNEDLRDFVNSQRDAARLLRISRPFNSFLARYVKGWLERQPDAPRPPGELPSTDGADEEAMDDASFALTPEEIEELERQDAQEMRDMDEAPDSPVEECEDDGADERDARADKAAEEDEEEAPQAKRAKTDEDAAEE